MAKKVDSLSRQIAGLNAQVKVQQEQIAGLNEQINRHKGSSFIQRFLEPSASRSSKSAMLSKEQLVEKIAALEAQLASKDAEIEHLESQLETRPEVSSCDCNQSPQAIMAASIDSPEVVHPQWNRLPVYLQKMLSSGLAAELRSARDRPRAFDEVAKAVAAYVEEWWGGKWSCAVGHFGRFGMSYQSEGDTRYCVKIGKVSVYLEQVATN